MSSNLLVILGPTASGKTRIGVQVAKVLNGEIISADSRQVYRGMDIGTGKDFQEYGSIPFHLIDIVNPGDEFNVFAFQRHFVNAFYMIKDRGKVPVLVGGTGLYLDAALKGYKLPKVPINSDLRKELAHSSMDALATRLRLKNPSLHNTTDLLDRERLMRAIEIAEFRESGESPMANGLDLRSIVFGIRWERKNLRQRITLRLKERLNHGLIEEVARLHNSGVSWEKMDFYGLEYHYVARYLRGELNRNDLFQKLNSAIHQFAKRQETWFRRMERQGTVIHWVAGDKDPAGAILQMIRKTLP